MGLSRILFISHPSLSGLFFSPRFILLSPGSSFSPRFILLSPVHPSLPSSSFSPWFILLSPVHPSLPGLSFSPSSFFSSGSSFFPRFILLSPVHSSLVCAAFLTQDFLSFSCFHRCSCSFYFKCFTFTAALTLITLNVSLLPLLLLFIL